MPNNYGSLLQSIATQHIIETLGHQCDLSSTYKCNFLGADNKQ